MMHCYFIYGAGARHTTSPNFREAIEFRGIKSVEDQTLIFPALINNAAQKVSSYMKDVIGQIPSLPAGISNISARGMRYGGLHELQNHFNAGHMSGVFRGGWEKDFSETNNTSSTYSFGNWDLAWRGGKGISGHPNALAPVYPPTVECLSNCEGYSSIGLLLKEMYQSHFDVLQSPIRPFAFAMFAAFLRFLPDFERVYSQNHPILQVCKEHFRKFNLSYECILNWSNIVRIDYATKNTGANVLHHGSTTINASDVANIIQDLKNTVVRLEEQNRMLCTFNMELLRITKSNSEELQYNRQLTRQLQDSITSITMQDINVVTCTPPKKKRNRTSGDFNEDHVDNSATRSTPIQSSSSSTVLLEQQNLGDDCIAEEYISYASSNNIVPEMHNNGVPSSVPMNDPTKEKNNTTTVQQILQKAAERPTLIITGTSISIDVLIPKLLEFSWKYDFAKDISRQQKHTIKTGLEFIYSYFRPIDKAFMSEEAPSVYDAEQRTAWIASKNDLATALITQIKSDIYPPERKKRGNTNDCTLGAIVKAMERMTKRNTASTSTQKAISSATAAT